MSVEDMTRLILHVVGYATTMGSCVLWDSMVGHLVDDSVLDLRSLHDYCLVLSFRVVDDMSVVYSLNTRDILRPIKLIRIDHIHLPW